MTTTASTAEIRAWAQADGLDVAERGRLRPEVVEAYEAAQGPSARMKASVRRAGVQPKSSLREATVNTPDRAVAKPVSKAMKPLLVEVMAAVPAAAPVDTRVEDLQAAVEAFTVRVGQLESAASAPTVGRRWGRRS